MTQLPLGIQLHVDDAIATITLNQPHRHNALGKDDLETLSQHLQHITNTPDIRVLIITGNGEKSFCSGASLSELGSGAITGEDFANLTDEIARLPIPTIAAMNGSAYGGGSEIGLACDFRIGVEDMRLFIPAARIGLCYPALGVARFVNVLGVNATKRLLLASEELDGKALLSIGYLTQLVEREKLNEAALKLAQRMAKYAPLALKAMKAISDQAAQSTFKLNEADKIALQCNQSEDFKEGFRSIKEERSPNFKGR